MLRSQDFPHPVQSPLLMIPPSWPPCKFKGVPYYYLALYVGCSFESDWDRFG